MLPGMGVGRHNGVGGVIAGAQVAGCESFEACGANRLGINAQVSHRVRRTCEPVHQL